MRGNPACCTLAHAAGLLFLPANSDHPLAVVDKLLSGPEHLPPLMAGGSELLLPPRDALFPKHYVLLQDCSPGAGMDDARCAHVGRCSMPLCAQLQHVSA